MKRLPPGIEGRALIAPALLLALALAQIGGWLVFDLSPWKGGGFGMFSSNDHGAFRQVQVFEQSGAGERRVTVPSELDRLRRHVREIPREANLRRLGLALRREVPGLGPLRIEVLRTEFAPDSLEPSRERLAQLELR
jgi:hypothetical protein